MNMIGVAALDSVESCMGFGPYFMHRLQPDVFGKHPVELHGGFFHGGHTAVKNVVLDDRVGHKIPGMDPCICPTTPHHRKRLSKKTLHGPFEHLLNGGAFGLTLPPMVVGAIVRQLKEYTHLDQAQEAISSLLYSPANSLSFTLVKVSMVYLTSSNVWIAVGIKRSMMVSFGTTGYTTMEQKMP